MHAAELRRTRPVRIGLCILLLLGGSACAKRIQPPEQPNQWFMNQRVSAGSFVPVNARSRALTALATTKALVEAPGTWVNVGPSNVGGRVTSLALDPNDPDHIWLGSANGGVWTSTDNGSSWTPVFDDQTALSIGAIAAHPSDSNTVYVGTGEDNGGGFSYPGEGVFKTTDGGVTWTHLGLGDTRRIGRIAIDPVDPERVFVAAGGSIFVKDSNRGVYRSSDGGLSWERVLFVADDAGAVDVAIDPQNPNRVFAAIWQRHSYFTGWYIGGQNSGIWRSLDGGDTWERLANGLPAGDNVGRIGLAIAASNPSTVYALIINSAARLDGIYRSLDGGDSWEKRNNNATEPLFGGFSYYFGNIRVDPEDESAVYVLDVNLLRSNNGARSFTVVTRWMHVDFHDLIIGPGSRRYAGNDGGFYVSADDGGSWTYSETLPITQFYDICIDTLNPDRRFGGTQDNGTQRTTTGGAVDWVNVLGGDGMQCEVDPTDSNKVYAESQYGYINRSTDGGDTFQSATNGIDPGEGANWVAPIVLDRNTPTTLYTGFQRIYRSVDSAVTWSPISPDLDQDPGGGKSIDEKRDGFDDSHAHTQSLLRRTITAVAVSPVDGDVIWGGTDTGHVWVTDDGGATWSFVTPPEHLWVTEIRCDPFDARTAYLSVTGYRQGDRTPYLRVTTDLGQTWRDISAGLPQLPVNAIQLDPRGRGRIFVGTEIGVFTSDDGGSSYSAMREGMPYVVVLDFELHDATRTLYAATHGRSIYTFDLTQLPSVDRDGDGVANVDDCAPDDAGSFGIPELLVLSMTSELGGSHTLSWQDLSIRAGEGTRYDVARGVLSGLTAAGGTGASEALACGLASSTTSDPELPPVGHGFYYLARARNACAVTHWGFDSSGSERTSSACP